MNIARVCVPRQSRDAARNAELMGDDIVGILLSQELLRDAGDVIEDREPRLRRFVHDHENISKSCILPLHL